jgi:predicted small lipoprotein YifL
MPHKPLARVRFATTKVIFTELNAALLSREPFRDYYERKLTAIVHLGAPANSGHKMCSLAYYDSKPLGRGALQLIRESGRIKMNTLISMIFAGLVLGSLAGCPSQGPAERAGENVDEAVEEMKDEVDDATDAR